MSSLATLGWFIITILITSFIACAIPESDSSQNKDHHLMRHVLTAVYYLVLLVAFFVLVFQINQGET